MKKCITALSIIFLAGCATKYDHLYQQKPAFYSYAAGKVSGESASEEYNSKVYVTPASCQKVVTGLVAIKTLGLDHKYVTEASVTKQNGAIRDLVIKFSGDPTLNSERLADLLRPLKNSIISGHIILDSSTFQTSPYSHNLMMDDVGTSYATPVSAINIDKNLVLVRISPKQMLGFADVKADSGFRVKSEVITNDEPTSIRLSWVDGVLIAKGHINVKDSLLERKISPADHDKYISGKVGNVLSSLNIKGKIKIVKSKDKISADKRSNINKIESEPLREIIKPALKISDNLVFDSIYLSTIYSHANQNPDYKEEIKDWEQGNEIIKKLIKEHFEIDSGNALFVDGSGLSRYNRVQPMTLFALLKEGFKIPEFVDALASPGEDKSTLKNRTQLLSSIKAKTGSMSGISCLCGYNVNEIDPKVFVFITNSFAPPAKEIFGVMDNFINADLKK